MKLVAGMTGAAIGVRLLAALKGPGIETQLVISTRARATLQWGTPYSVQEVIALAPKSYSDLTPGVHSYRRA